MKYMVEYLPDKKIVRVKMKGRLNFQIAEEYSTNAVKLARQSDCTKFLIDHTETTERGEVSKIYAAGEEMQQFGFKNTDRIAILTANLDKHSKALEPIIINSRWSAVKYFDADSIQDAFNWLLESE